MKKKPLNPYLKKDILKTFEKFNIKWAWQIIRKMTIGINFEFESLFNTPNEKIRLKNRLERKRKNKIKNKMKRLHVM